jgi:hypothetical protein
MKVVRNTVGDAKFISIMTTSFVYPVEALRLSPIGR